jgi:DNA topoisomerase-1
MQYKQRIDLAKYGDIGQRVYENLKSFCTGKKSSDDIFDRLTVPVRIVRLCEIAANSCRIP